MKQPAPYFLSYAHKDLADVERLREVLSPLFKASAEFEFGEWIDQLILPGEHWKKEIEDALAANRFGLLLVSPEFLASSFITNHELPELLAKPLVVPVGLHQVLFDGSMDLKGLGDRQLFRDLKGRTFDGCKTMEGRRRFARELFTKTIALLKKYAC